MRELIIVGGGAGGLVCAVRAAELGLRPLVLERMDRVGKKLLATGNGRCNLMNETPVPWPRGGAFAGAVLGRWPAERQKAFWEGLGLRLRTEAEGRVYPASGQASTVLDVLRLALARLDVEILTGTEVRAIRRIPGGFRAEAGPEALDCRRIAVFGGGRAQPKLGSNGSGARLLAALGHTAVPERPSLAAIRTDPEPIRGLAGIRLRGEITVLDGDACLHREAGELLFAEDGISGVCAMNCSARLPERGGTLLLNLLPGMGFPDAGTLAGALLRRREKWPGTDAEQLFAGICVPRLAGVLCRQAGIRLKERRLGDLSPDALRQAADLAAAFPLAVRGTRDFEQAQVTRGGIDPAGFRPETMESRLVPGLYAGGEVLDADGPCGGYNLMFAFACGLTAAEAMGGKNA